MREQHKRELTLNRNILQFNVSRAYPVRNHCDVFTMTLRGRLILRRVTHIGHARKVQALVTDAPLFLGEPTQATLNHAFFATFLRFYAVASRTRWKKKQLFQPRRAIVGFRAASSLETRRVIPSRRKHRLTFPHKCLWPCNTVSMHSRTAG